MKFNPGKCKAVHIGKLNRVGHVQSIVVRTVNGVNEQGFKSTVLGKWQHRWIV